MSGAVYLLSELLNNMVIVRKYISWWGSWLLSCWYSGTFIIYYSVIIASLHEYWGFTTLYQSKKVLIVWIYTLCPSGDLHGWDLINNPFRLFMNHFLELWRSTAQSWLSIFNLHGSDHIDLNFWTTHLLILRMCFACSHVLTSVQA